MQGGYNSVQTGYNMVRTCYIGVLTGYNGGMLEIDWSLYKYKAVWLISINTEPDSVFDCEPFHCSVSVV